MVYTAMQSQEMITVSLVQSLNAISQNQQIAELTCSSTKVFNSHWAGQ